MFSLRLWGASWLFNANTLLYAKRLINREGPTWLGRIWNALVIFILAVMIRQSVIALIKPTPQDAVYPLWYRIWLYYAIIDAWFIEAAYLALDKRRMKRRLPWPATFTAIGRVLIFTAITFGTFVVLVIVQLLPI